MQLLAMQSNLMRKISLLRKQVFATIIESRTLVRSDEGVVEIRRARLLYQEANG